MDYALQLRLHRALMSAPLWLRQAVEMTSPRQEWALALRDITSATDSRTSIATIVPIGRVGGAHFALLWPTYWPEVQLGVSRERWWREQRAGLDSPGFPTAASLNEHLWALGLGPVRAPAEQVAML